MARRYKFRFRNLKTHEVQEEVGHAGTKRMAERLARASMRDRLGIPNTQEWYRASVKFDGSY